ncbi:MAG TPA: glycoside hydrolase family 15 protein [Solirubrobacterales bacterium]|nr:glycoside hydrolase family 15 protein [Solirubrobacterales bacterium]
MRRAEAPTRIDGYAPIGDYAAIGDGRTVALVARDGAVDWLPLPDLDSPSVFAAVLDAERGGRFELTPEEPFEVERRYLPGTNVLETTFRTAGGAVRVTDALTLPDAPLGPLRELTRRVEGLSGRMALRWRVEPRFHYGAGPSRLGLRDGIPIASVNGTAIAIRCFEAGEPEVLADSIGARFEAVEGSRAMLALCAAHQEPLVFPARDELEERLERTVDTWRNWTDRRSYDGPWRDEVMRSILALKLLVFAPSGAVAAAATTSLPEEIGGERNWDYRFSWVRDAAFTLDALLELDCSEEAHAYFWWVMHASQITHPDLQVLYRLDGGHHAEEVEHPELAGYRGSRPVRTGNAAVDQLQLDTFGELMQTAWLYARDGNRIDRDLGARLAEIADHVCEIWRKPDSGIWEVRSDPRDFTQSKMMCAIALDRALALARRGCIPHKHTARWKREQKAIRDFVDSRCWSEEKRSYVRFAGDDELDASILLGALFGFGDPRSARWVGTVEAVRRELTHGPFVTRYPGEDGLRGQEGAFLCCSFWLAEALARTGRVDEAVSLMDDLVGLANDVGLYAEEVDRETGEPLGNVPQGLSHLSLISAARAIGREMSR